MVSRLLRALALALATLPALGAHSALRAQEPAPEGEAGPGPLRIRIEEGVVEPVPVALAPFVTADDDSEARDLARRIGEVITTDLEGTGLFRAVPPDAFITSIVNFDAPVQFSDWKAINAQALITGEVSDLGDRISVKFRLFDVFAEGTLGQGLQLAGPEEEWRRIAHRIAGEVYSRITGEAPYFDSRIVLVAETGPKDARVKRLAIMDYDGANLRYLTDGSALVLAPRLSPDGRRVLYTSYESGFPRIRILDLGSGSDRALEAQEGTMSFAPRFSPDGGTVVYSLTRAGNTDLYTLDLASGRTTRLTEAASIETAPGYSPDGNRIVFESDRSGSQQLYVMPATGGEARRISRGEGRYGTPVWSPRGDLIAFTNQEGGRFHIGVMRPDGSEERLLTSSFLDEGPSWAPGGRVLVFARQSAGATAQSALYTVDASGRNLRRIQLETGGSDPSWGPPRR